MKANELRIGNLFVDKKTKTIINIIGLTEQYITFSGHFKNDWQAKPIPLTEEWLLKFGFDKHFEDFEKKIVGFYLTYNFNDGISLNGKYMDEPIYIDGEYVHQLQNLYFALTGEELTIN